MKKFMSEFKEFISKGDVMSMAVGIIIGGAFTAIVSSLVGDVITPLLGIIIGGIDFSGIVISVGSAQILRKKEKKPQAEPAPPEPSEEVKLLSEIRDLLKDE